MLQKKISQPAGKNSLSHCNSVHVGYEHFDHYWFMCSSFDYDELVVITKQMFYILGNFTWSYLVFGSFHFATPIIL